MSGKLYATFQEYLANEYDGPKYHAVDILIRYPKDGLEGLVLIGRKFAPFGIGSPGGIAKRMQLFETAVEESSEETGLDVFVDTPTWKPFAAFSHPDDDPREYISTTVYTAAGYGEIRPRKGEDAKWAKVFSISEVRELLAKPEMWAMQRHRRFIGYYINERYPNGDRVWNEPIRR